MSTVQGSKWFMAGTNVFCRTGFSQKKNCMKVAFAGPSHWSVKPCRRDKDPTGYGTNILRETDFLQKKTPTVQEWRLLAQITGAWMARRRDKDPTGYGTNILRKTDFLQKKPNCTRVAFADPNHWSVKPCWRDKDPTGYGTNDLFS